MSLPTALHGLLLLLQYLGLSSLLVQYAQILIRLSITLVMLDRRIDPDRFERGFLPRGDYIPPNAPIREVIQCGESLRQ